jgi:predicted AlkP superfamily phosphohydrolase/phosphomutase
MSDKLLVIGLDGATFDWIDQLVEAGRLPTFARLIGEGVRAELRSTFPPITAVAWTSLATGKNPGKHGIFEFILSRNGGQRQIAANASARDGEAIWDLLSRAGLRVIVTNFPCTYPPSQVNGFMISDFMTPRGRRDFTHPKSLLDEIEQAFGPYRLYLTQTYAPGNVRAVLDELFDELQYKSLVNRYLMRHEEWDVLITHIWGTDRIQHELWHVIDPAHPRYRESESQQYRERICQYWDQVDEELSRLITEAGDDVTVWVVSDHGFGPIHKYCSFNVWLLEQGFLQLKTDALSRFKRLLFNVGLTPELAYKISRSRLLARLRPARGVTTQAGSAGRLSKMFLSFNDVDWKHTPAYSKGNYGQIFINLKGREQHGVVEPGGQYERVKDEIITCLRQIVDPDTGEPLLDLITTKEEMYDGPHLDDAPDISFLPRDMRYLALGSMDFSSNKFIVDAFGNSGGHRMNGILVACGPHLRSGLALDRLTIYDVAPTLLYQLGLEVPRDMDGRVVAELFAPEFVREHPVHFCESAERKAPAEVVFTPEEESEIEERLKHLGYLG